MNPTEREKLLKDPARLLFERYYPAVLNFFLRFGFPLEDARDLAQMVFVRVCQSVEQFKGEAAWAYLKRIAVRIALNRRREESTIKRSRREVSLDGDPTLTERLAGDTLSPEDELRLKENLRAVRAALAELPEAAQRCLQLQVMQERSYREIQDLLELSLDAVKARLKDARKRLRARLRENSGRARLALRTPEVDRDQES